MKPLLDEVRESAGVLHDTREEARATSREAMRLLEANLVDALDGERLRGVPCLNQGAPDLFYAARVRGKEFTPLPVGRGVLVVDDAGMLMIATRQPDGAVDSRPAEAEDLLAEDLEPFAILVASLIRRHLDRVILATNRYAACRTLAQAIREALTKKHEGGRDWPWSGATLRAY